MSIAVIKTRNSNELSHPGFILFEGMDFSGKSYIAKKVVELLFKNNFIDVIYNANSGFLNNDLVNPEILMHMNSADKVNYVLSCYDNDRLPNNPLEYKEIIQDRHVPSIIFYGMFRAGMSLDNIFDSINDIENIEKPKNIFLFRASYEDSVNRATERKTFTLLEKMILDNPKEFSLMQKIYEEIIERFNTPITNIDTSKLDKDECINYCIDTIMNNHLMDYPLSLEDIYVDTYPSVFSSTVEKRKDDFKNGERIIPVVIKRVIDNDHNYIDLLDDGRHRAFAAHSLGLSTVNAHINYEYGILDKNRLVSIPMFKFRREYYEQKN